MTENSKKKSAQVTLSELDERLMADEDGSVKQEILDKLKPYQEDLKSKIAKGEFTPDEFEVAKKMEEALKQAEAMIRQR